MAIGCGYAWERYDGENPQSVGDDDDTVDAGDDDDDDGTGNLAGDKIDNFTWEAVGGGQINLYDYEGYVVLLNVAAGWCEACKEETPVLEDLFWQVFGDRKFVVIQVLTETAEGRSADQEFGRQWREEYDINFPLGLDPDWSLMPYFTEQTLPFTMVLDRELRVRVKTHGFDADILSALVEKFL